MIYIGQWNCTGYITFCSSTSYTRNSWSFLSSCYPQSRDLCKPVSPVTLMGRNVLTAAIPYLRPATQYVIETKFWLNSYFLFQFFGINKRCFLVKPFHYLDLVNIYVFNWLSLSIFLGTSSVWLASPRRGRVWCPRWWEPGRTPPGRDRLSSHSQTVQVHTPILIYFVKMLLKLFFIFFVCFGVCSYFMLYYLSLRFGQCIKVFDTLANKSSPFINCLH